MASLLPNVLINKDSGQPELIPEEQTQQALASTHNVPLVDQNNKLISVSQEDAPQLLSTGYRTPTPDELKGAMDYAKYSSIPEQLKTFVESAAEAGTLGVSSMIQDMAGSDPHARNLRRRVNPGVHVAGQLTGLTASAALPGEGALGALKGVGELAEEGIFGSKAADVYKMAGQAGVPGTLPLAERSARGATRLAAEGSLFQAGDELSKKFEQDPNQTMQSAIMNTGLAALTAPVIGGAFEGTKALWDATAGKTLSSYMQAAREKIAMGSGASDAIPASQELLNKYPEVRAALGDSPTVEETHQHLLNSPTKSGQEYRSAVGGFRQDATNEALDAMGYKPEDVSNLKESSNFDKGEDIVKMLSSDLKGEYEPIKGAYDQVQNKYGGVELSPVDKTNIGSQVADIADKQGYNLSPSSPEAQEIGRLQKEIPNLKTIEDLRKYRTIFDNNASQKQLWGLRRNVLDVLDNTRDSAITKALGDTEGPDALAFHNATNQNYRGLMSKIENLNDRLRVGRYSGPESFIKNLGDMRPEDVLNRLNPKNDAGLISSLQEQFPGVADVVRKSQLDSLVKASSRNDQFSLNNFVNKLDANNISQEAREFLLGKDSYDKVKGIKQMLDDLPYTDNPSGTAKASARNFGKLPWHMGAAALLAHGNPLLAGLSELGGTVLTKEIPDALRVSWLRFLGNGDLPVSASAFKAVTEAANNAAKGISTIEKTIPAVLSGKVGNTEDKITPKQKKDLEKSATTYAENPEKYMNMGQDLAQYEPAHASAQAGVVARAMQVINAAKPKEQQLGMLDKPVPPGKYQQAEYEKTLNIVQNPMSVLHKIGKGALTPNELGVFKTVYPDLHNLMSEKITNHLIKMKTNGMQVPYKQRLSLSMFMGTPLDSSMMPAAIASNQPNPMQPATPSQQMPHERGSKKALSDMPGMYATPGQSREQARAYR